MAAGVLGGFVGDTCLAQKVAQQTMAPVEVVVVVANTGAAMVVGSGASLATSGSGSIAATAVGSGTYLPYLTAGVPGAATAAQVVSLFSTCSGSQYLGADGACHNDSGGCAYGLTLGNVVVGGGAGNCATAVSSMNVANPGISTEAITITSQAAGDLAFSVRAATSQSVPIAAFTRASDGSTAQGAAVLIQQNGTQMLLTVPLLTLYNGSSNPAFAYNSGSVFLGGSAELFGFSSATNPYSAGCDTCFSRISAGLFGAGSGAQGSTAGSISLTNLTAAGTITAPFVESTGTKFTISGCSAGTTVGGAAAGSFLSGTSGTCTVVITLNGATGATAPNGWTCYASDLTTPADILTQSASSTTTCTITGTTVSGDKLQFMAMAF